MLPRSGLFTATMVVASAHGIRAAAQATFAERCQSSVLVDAATTDAAVPDQLNLLPILNNNNDSLIARLNITRNTSGSLLEGTATADTFELSSFMASLSSAGRIGPQPSNITGIEMQSRNNAVSTRPNNFYVLQILSFLLVLWIQGWRTKL